MQVMESFDEMGAKQKAVRGNRAGPVSENCVEDVDKGVEHTVPEGHHR
jgi:hypothetical protein